jgi:class 3 adenylate cyclase
LPFDSAFIVVGLFAIGMSLTIVWADPKSPTSRALALMFSIIGVLIILNVPAQEKMFGIPGRMWERVFSVGEALAFIAGFEWNLRIRRTEFRGAQARGGEGMLRLAQGLMGIYGLMGVLFPEMREPLYKARSQMLHVPTFYLLAAPVALSLVIGAASIWQILRSNPDSSERVRMIALGGAIPFFVPALFVPLSWKPILVAIGEVIFLAGVVRYHVLQGQRGQFLARFLSPQVAEMVREKGLLSAMQQNRHQLTVVACDLRGFTAFSETSAPEEVIDLLREYYGAVGDVVLESGGTIKDLAGDGILCLVGAPIPLPDHAARATEMALRMLARGGEVLARWKKLGLELGLGVGIASGYVTVGAIESGSRLEYVAVGPPVNLASRLCDRAESGQVLVDQRTVGLVGENGLRFEKLEPAELKGFSRAVPVYRVLA